MERSSWLAIARRSSTRLFGTLIDRELTLLNAAYRLAKRQERLSRTPYVPLYHADNVRQGFTHRETLDKVRSNLRPVLSDVALFAYLSAWRRDEDVSLEWSRVDRRLGKSDLERRRAAARERSPLRASFGASSSVAGRRGSSPLSSFTRAGSASETSARHGRRRACRSPLP